MSAARIGLISGSGRLPILFAVAARAEGHAVHAAAHLGETDPHLVTQVDSLTWVKVGQVGAILRAFKAHGVEQAVMAGAIGRVRSLTQARPDAGMLQQPVPPQRARATPMSTPIDPRASSR